MEDKKFKLTIRNTKNGDHKWESIPLSFNDMQKTGYHPRPNIRMIQNDIRDNIESGIWISEKENQSILIPPSILETCIITITLVE